MTGRPPAAEGTLMSLGDKLDAYWRDSARRLGPEVAQLFDTFVQNLAAGGMLDSCLKVGDRIPDFMLPSADGRLVASAELLERGPLVISFFRGDWCPYCSLELQALQEALPQIEALGATLVAVTPDTGAALASDQRSRALSYCVLSDADNGVGLQFGVVYRVPDAIRQLYLGFGLDLGTRHGNSGWFLPIPATYIVDRDGVIRAAALEVDFRRRMEPAAIIAALRAIAAQVGSGSESGGEVAGPAQPDEGVERR